MNKYLWLIILFLYIGAGNIESNVIVQDDVIISNTLPDWGTVCVASEVRGGPDEMYPVRYSVPVGTRVRIHDQSQPIGTWVSIKAAHWVPLQNICFDERN